MSKTQTENPESAKFDLFNWANQAERHKKDFKLELLVINKHFTPFSLNLDAKLEAQTKTLFLYDLINKVNQGVETGLQIERFESVDREKDSVLRTTTDRVERADYLINFLTNRQSEILPFTNEEHDFRLIRGLVAKIWLDNDDEQWSRPFYVVKQITPSQAVLGAAAWQLEGNKVTSFVPDVALKIPLDAQTLLIDDQIFVFNASKFERLFGYDYQKLAIAEEKIKAIEERFRLSFPEGLTMQSLVKERKKSITKLQKLELTTMNQEELVEYADEMSLELMTDQSGAIIILDGNDLDMFLGLLNEDYMVSSVTNNRYEITGKKPLGEPTGEPPRG